MQEIYQAVMAAALQKMHFIGNVLVAKSKRKILTDNIKAEGDFYANTEYRVLQDADKITLHIGSNVPHEPYVLGGKVPSWTPLKPLKAWVERKDLGWTHKAGKHKGEEMTVEDMARAIMFKIKAKGIPERNVFADVIEKEVDWIFAQLDSLEVVL